MNQTGAWFQTQWKNRRIENMWSERKLTKPLQGETELTLNQCGKAGVLHRNLFNEKLGRLKVMKGPKKKVTDIFSNPDSTHNELVAN